MGRAETGKVGIAGAIFAWDLWEETKRRRKCEGTKRRLKYKGVECGLWTLCCVVVEEWW